MDDPALTEFIIHELGRQVSKNDLTFNICQRTGLSWEVVTNLIAEIEQKHYRQIALKQSPLLLLIAVGILIGGLWAFCGGVLFFINFARAGSISLNPLDLRRDYLTVIRVGTGLAMIIGSMIGIVQVALSIYRGAPTK